MASDTVHVELSREEAEAVERTLVNAFAVGGPWQMEGALKKLRTALHSPTAPPSLQEAEQKARDEE